MSSTRRARAKVSLAATGDLYLLHFHQRLGTGKHSIQHYLGNPAGSGIPKGQSAEPRGRWGPGGCV
jgi:hypothetical protein